MALKQQPGSLLELWIHILNCLFKILLECLLGISKLMYPKWNSYPTPHKNYPKQLQPPMNPKPSASLAALPISGNSSSVLLISQAPNLEVILNSVFSLLTPHPVYQQILMFLSFFIYIYIFLINLFKKFIHSFIYGCIGSSLLQMGFL